MKMFEENMNAKNEILKGLVVEESTNSLIVIAKKKIFVPEKKIIFLDQMSDQEAQLLMRANTNKGGLII